MGGIAYTNVFPIERIYRDVRLASIWTGTSEVMSMITLHEWYREYFLEKAKHQTRDYEMDAPEASDDEKVYDDEDMWSKGWWAACPDQPTGLIARRKTCRLMTGY
jgi:adenine-specific DNA methylase